MADIMSRVQGVTDREKWVERRVSFVAKLKATKAVWFPPAPVKSGKKAASTAKKTTGRAAKKTAGTAKKTTSRTKKASKAAAAKA